MPYLMSIRPSTAKGKRYTATFCLCHKRDECKGGNHSTTHFGQDTATTYIDGASEEKKKSYLARHSKSPGQDWSKPMTAGSLAMNILWGASRSIKENIKAFKKKFRL
tara:strand:- start:1410 stop:1730 length:321 start_codon:yes stop_codon:yes gene_type:complete